MWRMRLRSNSVVYVKFPVLIEPAWELKPNSFHFEACAVCEWVYWDDDDEVVTNQVNKSKDLAFLS